jgi:D-alanyl-D-alanine carboxypeptidase (penicillin-binding protein 5/6)
MIRVLERSLRLFAAAALMLGTVAAAQPAPSAAPAGPVRHSVILDYGTGAVLACDRCEEPIPPASMSKLMTILIVAEALQSGDITMDTVLPVSEAAWRHGAVSAGSHMFLELGSQVRVGDLLRGVIIVSANDACVALAEGIAGSQEAFVARMNQRAGELGLTTARFRNVTGLDEPDHQISPLDLARLAAHIIRTYPDIYALYSERSFTFNNRTQENRNPLLGAFGGADGVKTGHTNASGYGLIGSAEVDGQRRIIVFNGEPTMAARRETAIRMMRSAFYDFRVHTLFAAGAEVARAPVWLGGRADVALVAPQDIAVAAPVSAFGGLSAHVVLDGPVRAPVAEGDEVGRLVVEGPGFETQTFPLTAGERVGRANPFARALAGVGLAFSGDQ